MSCVRISFELELPRDEDVCPSRRLSERPGSASRGDQRQDRSTVATSVLVGALDGRRHQIDPELAPANAQYVEGEHQHRDHAGNRADRHAAEQPCARVGPEIGK